MGYALWLVPSRAEHDALRNLMHFRPSVHGMTPHSARSYPDLTPHVTLLTFSSAPPGFLSLDALLPSNLHVTSTHFETLRVGDNYLGSLSIVVRQSRHLMAFHDAIVDHLEHVRRIPTKSRRFPHMSLFYLDEAFAGERAQLAQELRDTGRITGGLGDARTGTALVLNCALDGARDYPAMAGFKGEEIWLVDCSGSVRDWKVLEKRLLQHRGSQPSRSHSLPAPHGALNEYGQGPLPHVAVTHEDLFLPEHRTGPPPGAPVAVQMQVSPVIPLSHKGTSGKRIASSAPQGAPATARQRMTTANGGGVNVLRDGHHRRTNPGDGIKVKGGRDDRQGHGRQADDRSSFRYCIRWVFGGLGR